MRDGARQADRGRTESGGHVGAGTGGLANTDRVSRPGRVFFLSLGTRPPLPLLPPAVAAASLPGPAARGWQRGILAKIDPRACRACSFKI